jgi:hypothetical protein
MSFDCEINDFNYERTTETVKDNTILRVVSI